MAARNTCRGCVILLREGMAQMKAEYNLAKMKSRKNPYTRKLKEIAHQAASKTKGPRKPGVRA